MPPLPRRRPFPKQPWSQPLADLVGRTLDPVLARQGFGESDLILHWDDIVGERLAANSRPIKLQWPPRPPAARSDPTPATLVIRVDSGFAIELQHMADQVLARINAHLGWRCVGKLAFRQGPIEQREVALRKGGVPTAAALASAKAKLGTIDDEALGAALARLGAHILG